MATTTRVLDAIASTPWAIQETALHTILEIAERVHVDEATLRQWRRDDESRLEALVARGGSRLSGTHGVLMRDGVAVLSIVGPVFPRANLMTEFSGAVSLGMMARDFQVAVDDPGVVAIVLAIDSPGGLVTGVAEFAALLRRATEIKPVVGYVEGVAASAAYWIAAACGEVVLASTASVGSVGAVVSIRDSREREARSGVREWQFVSAQSPRKQVDPATGEGRDVYQEVADEAAAVFVADVARYRAVAEDHVLARFGRGGMVSARNAVSAEIGMADRVAVLEDVLAGLAGRERGGAAAHPLSAAGAPRAQEEIAMSETQTGTPASTPKPAPLTVAHVRAEAPEVATALIEEGRAAGHAAGLTEGAAAERTRVAAIEDAALPGHGDLVIKAKAEGMAPETFLAAMVAAEKSKRQGALASMQTGAGEAPLIPPQMETGSASSTSEGAPLEQRAKATWDRDPALRAEFGDFDAYRAYIQARQDGRVKILSRKEG